MSIYNRMHSTISIGPLQVHYYSLQYTRRANGSLFHTEGPTTENAQVCLVEVQVRAKGSKSTPMSLSAGSCDLWCPRWDRNGLAGRPLLCAKPFLDYTSISFMCVRQLISTN